MSNSFTKLFGLLSLTRSQGYQSHFQVYYETLYRGFKTLNLHSKNFIFFSFFHSIGLLHPTFQSRKGAFLE